MTTAPPFSFGSTTWPGLAKVAEEAGETTQVIGKFLATGGDPEHWDGTDLRLRLMEEIGDLLAAIGFVGDHNDLDIDFIRERAVRKRALFESWHAEHTSDETDTEAA